MYCALTGHAKFRPWRGVSAVKPGDVAVVVVDTDPKTVLCAIVRESRQNWRIAVQERFDLAPVVDYEHDAKQEEVRPSNHKSRLNMRVAISLAPRLGYRGLREVTDIEAFAGGYSLNESSALPLDSPAVQALVEVVSEPTSSSSIDCAGHSSVAAARILLGSEGRCTCCEETVDVLGDSAGRQYTINTVSEGDLREGRDWPALLCSECCAAMKSSRFSKAIDYGFSFHPACPACSATRTRRNEYGLPAATYVTPPWRNPQGCCIDRGTPSWSCGACGQTWGVGHPPNTGSLRLSGANRSGELQ